MGVRSKFHPPRDSDGRFVQTVGHTPHSRFGNVAVLGFLFVQWLDWGFTYIGMAVWGPGIEANPLISSAVAYAGVGPGLTAAKLLAVCIMLHLRGVHFMVALLTAVYVAVAIVPWVAIFAANL